MENLSIEGFLGLIFGIVMIFRYKSWGREATNLYNNLPEWMSLRRRGFRHNEQFVQIGFLLAGIIFSILGLLDMFGITR